MASYGNNNLYNDGGSANYNNQHDDRRWSTTRDSDNRGRYEERDHDQRRHEERDRGRHSSEDVTVHADYGRDLPRTHDHEERERTDDTRTRTRRSRSRSRSKHHHHHDDATTNIAPPHPKGTESGAPGTAATTATNQTTTTSSSSQEEGDDAPADTVRACRKMVRLCCEQGMPEQECKLVLGSVGRKLLYQVALSYGLPASSSSERGENTEKLISSIIGAAATETLHPRKRPPPDQQEAFSAAPSAKSPRRVSFAGDPAPNFRNLGPAEVAPLIARSLGELQKDLMAVSKKAMRHYDEIALWMAKNVIQSEELRVLESDCNPEGRVLLGNLEVGSVAPIDAVVVHKGERHHKGSEYDHIHGYLELFRHRTGVNPSLSVVDYSTVASSTDMLRASMPVMKFEKLTPNGVSETPQMVSAFVGIDDAITANAALYKAETAGVFALLDIQSLGRIQQTSRFWYHVARSNSCWKQALLNSSATWQDDTRTVLRHFLSLMEIESDQTKWKHVSFVWMSRNYCTGCGHAYRCCDGTQCTENRPRLMHHSAIEYSVLNNYCKAYETAYNAWHESLCWEDCFVHYVCQWKQLDEEDPFASAVYTGHVHVARFLLKKGYLWATTLHLCVQKQLTDLIDFILQSASGLERRVELLGMRNRTVTSPLEVAMYSGNMELIRLLVNEKWGGIQFIEALEDQQQPIAKYCDWEKARPDVLQFLCQLFHKRLETADVKPLYRAILRNNQDLAMMLLSLGANPNASFRYGRLPGDNSFFALMEFTPMTFAVVLNRSELVTEMGKLGGLLPEDCDLWRHFLEQGFRHIHGYLESRRLRVRRHVPVSDYSQILGSTDMLRASLPVIKLEKLAPNGVSEIPQMISASVDCDDTITSNASLCQAEAVGVLTFLDVQSLGRMQRTSRFWYQSGSSNSCWKQALLNSQVAWTENRTRQVFTHFLNFIELIDQIEWKHVSFLWMSQNYCVKCEHVFHRFRGTRCQIGGESEHSLLDRYYEAYDRAWCLEYKEGCNDFHTSGLSLFSKSTTKENRLLLTEKIKVNFDHAGMGQAVGTPQSQRSHYQDNQDSIIPFVKDNELLVAATKAQAIKLSWLVSRTPVGHEEDACWVHWLPRVSINVLFVCASLGHLEELMIVYNAWHERPWWEDRLAHSECQWAQWERGTPLACAVNEGHVQVARFLMEKCGQRPDSWCTLDGKKVTALHLCVQKQLLELIDPILQSVGDLKRRVDLLGMSDGTVTSPLGVAMRSNNMELMRLLVNEKWGGTQFIEALDDQQQPIAVYCGCEEARPDVLQFLCHLFHKGLGRAFVNATQYPRWSATNRELLDILVNHPNFPDCIKSESTPERAPTPLFVAILRNHQDLALKFLSLGANPNAPCTHQLGNYRDEFTPMILAVILNRSELVTEMVKLGGVLPSEECDIWKHHKGSEYDHIHGYLELFRHRTGVNPSLSVVDYSTVASSTDMLRASMPVMKFEKLTPNGVSETPQMVSAFVGIDDAITANAALYKAETAGVLTFLDIQSLGRIQRTSRFWYHVGRSNSCWMQALLNSSVTWQDATKMVLRHFLSLMEIESDQTKWKHVSFVWMSRNYCTGCGHAYRCCDGTQCTENRPRLMHHSAIEYSVLNNYCKAYETADCVGLRSERGARARGKVLAEEGCRSVYLVHSGWKKDLIDPIMQSVGDLKRRVELLCNEQPPPDSLGAGVTITRVISPLEMAIRSNNMELIRLLVNERWGGNEFIEALDNKQQPVAKYYSCEEARSDVLQYLCQVFHKRLETAGEIPLFMAILRNNKDLAMMALSLGANPNAPCTYKLRDYEDIFTPMILAVILDRSELVTEMVKLGGLLPCQDCDFWKDYRGYGYGHINGYLGSHIHRIVGFSVSNYPLLLRVINMLQPVMEFENLAPNGVSETPLMVSASVGCDDTITANAALCQAEAAGVLTFLDVQSLGRMQRTSRFWYHAGRSNLCWKQALLNSSAVWTENRAREVFRYFLYFIGGIDRIEWKHVSFIWMSRNYCPRCRHSYRCCGGTRCQISRQGKLRRIPGTLYEHDRAIEHSILDMYYVEYDRAWRQVGRNEGF
ncbi:hypothetical protein Pelo_4769 [Pelomyxa schiedti]|nr:hypothetical protein Pelo_4769 [Pelomyxa schiedti]